MPLTPGTRIGAYDVVLLLGAGGMGEVYRVRDTKLRRDVALKVLPDLFARDPDRLARFTREAHVLASLNHPHIAAIYGIEETSDITALVMELVEGPTLAERVEGLRAKGTGLPIDEALKIAAQIADALDAAHEKGIVHRDLKPANIKVREDGTVKVLDFGLAKALTEDSRPDATMSPTLTAMASKLGVIVGTAAYMSPEQAKGKAVDKRTDIWAFGCVLYEMLTGARAFAGDDVTDFIVSVMTKEPDWTQLPASTPPCIVELLKRCLKKDSRERLRDIGDARLDLAAAPAVTNEAPVDGVTLRGQRRYLIAAVATLSVSLGVVVTLDIRRSRPDSEMPKPIAHAAVPLPAATPIPFGEQPVVALSPDGTNLVYVAQVGSTTQLFLRHLDQDEAAPMAGTEGASGPFFSPDGQSIAFFANDKLLRSSLAGGRPLTIADAPRGTRGASWADNGDIVFAQSTSRLLRVSATGGRPRAIVPGGTVDGSRNGFIWPQVLPGGKRVLFTAIQRGNMDDARIAVMSLENGAIVQLNEVGAYARYVPTGHIVFSRGGTVYAVPYDIASSRTRGDPLAVLENVLDNPFTGAAHVAVSDTGVMVYVPASPSHTSSGDRRLVWVNRRGDATPLPLPAGVYGDPRLSPDGGRLAVTLNGRDVAVYDLARGTSIRLTPDGTEEFESVWTPDGKRVAFSSTSGSAVPNLFWAAADGSGRMEQLAKSSSAQFANSWTPDGEVLIFTTSSTSGDTDTSLLRGASRERRIEPFLDGPSNDWSAKISPEGRWVAYVSDESGRSEVYVRPYPGREPKTPISSDGGAEPVWSRDGRELFYRAGSRMMVVSVDKGPVFAASKPQMLFDGDYELTAPGYPNYDVSVDGRMFLMIKRTEQETASRQLNLIVNWFEELKRRVPTR